MVLRTGVACCCLAGEETVLLPAFLRVGQTGVEWIRQGYEFLLEFGDHGLGGPGGGFTKGADRFSFNLVGHFNEQIHIRRGGFSFQDAGAEFHHPRAAFPAGGALPAGFMGVETVDVVHGPGHGAGVVHDDDRAGTGHGAVLGDAVQIQRNVEEGDFSHGAVRILHFVFRIRAHDLGGGASGYHGLELAPVPRAAADVIQQFAEGHGAGDDFIEPRTFDVAGNPDDAGAGGTFGPFLAVGFSSHGHDVFHLAEGFHVVDNGGASVQADGGREVGGLDAGIGAIPFKGVEQGRFLTANVRSRSAVQVDFQIIAGPLDIAAQEAAFAGFLKGFEHDFRGDGKFFAHVDISLMSPHCVAGDDHSFNELVGILVDNVAVLERAWFGFVTVANQVNRLRVVRRNEGPFHAGGEPRAATAAKTGFFHLVNDGPGLHAERLFQFFITAVGQIAVNGGIPALAVDVFQNAARFPGVGFFTGKIGDAHGENLVRGKWKGLGCLIFGNHFFQHFRSDFFVQEIVDHHVGAKAAVGQAFHSFHAPQAVRADSNGVVVVDAVFVNAQTRADGVEQAVRPRHGAGKSAAYADVVFSRAHLAQTGIESHHAQNMGGGDIQFFSHPGNGVAADEAEFFLYFMQDGQHGGFLLAFRVMRNVFAGGGVKFRRYFKGRVKQFARAGLVGDSRVDGVFSVIGHGEKVWCLR